MRCLALVVLLASSVASAQDGDEARSLAREGTDALSSGDFVQARALLSRSLELERRPAVAFNLAVALRRIGEPTASLSLLRQIEAGEYGDIEQAQVAQLRELMSEVRRELATVRVSVRGVQRAEIRVDGIATGAIDGDGELTLEVDPGSHNVVAYAEDREPIERRLDVAVGGAERIEIRFPPTLLEPEPEPSEESGSDLTWLVVVVGVAAAVAAVVAVVFVVTAEGDLERDAVFGSTPTLTARF